MYEAPYAYRRPDGGGAPMTARDDGPWRADDEDEAPPARLRVPPHSVEAEQSVIGSLLVDNKALGDISDVLAASDFYRHEHRLVFGAIKAAVDAGQPADPITLFEKLEADGKAAEVGGLQALEALGMCVPNARHIRRYAEIVRERAIRRKLIATSDEIATAAFNPQGREVAALLGEAEERLAEIAREQHRKLPGSKLPFLKLDALRQASEAVRWAIKHVIPAESIGMLFGGSGTFKSFIALDCALHIAHGLPWMGRRTTKGTVLYIAAEGGAGLWARIDAWHRARRLKWQDASIFVVPVAIDLTVDAWRVVDAAQAVGVTPSLVVVDTLSQTYAGEENSANEMAAYLRELGLRFRSLWQAAVLLIHHSGHSATERPRGSSAIRGNVDFLLGVFRDEKEMLATVTCMKQKDGELFPDATFALQSLELGTDADGDKVTSLVARHLNRVEDVTEAMQAETKAGRGGRTQLLLSLLQNGMSEASLRKAFYDDCGITDTEARKKAYQRAKAWIQHAQLAEFTGGVVITLQT